MSSLDFNTVFKQEEEHLRKVHPTPEDVPGCMRLLDEFMMCHVISAQVKSLYRYGHMSECGQKFEDFKFCMMSKSSHPEERRDAWLQRRAEWWARRRTSRSSEDVWEVRTEPLPNFPPPHPESRLTSSNTVE